MDRSVVLSVGDSYHLRFGKDRVIYAGMPSEDTNSIMQRKSAWYQGFAWDLFYPRKKREIKIDGVNIYRENVTPDEIRLRVL